MEVFKEELITELCTLDAQIIAMAFLYGETLGIAAIQNSIAGFTTILRKHKGVGVLALDLDYRTYIITLLKYSLEAVEEPYKTVLFREIVLPRKGGGDGQ